jgi:arylsulfatase A-like enzyme/Tfp pilus assembly protein PilF
VRSPGRRAAAAVTAALLLAAAPAAAADQPRAARRRPNILLITIDTLRPDALGWIGHSNNTPAIDALAARGFRFPRAVTPVPLTLPAHASIMTGLVPRRHGVRDNGQTFGAGPTTLAETLRAAGWSTAAFVSGFPLQRLFGLDRGFDHYDDALPEGREGWVERFAAGTTAAALEWLAAAPQPWFVWVHYYDPHDPYEPPRAFWGPGERGSYLGEVRYTDYGIERLVDGLSKGDGRTTLTVLTADHGEALGDHSEKRHGYFIYDATMTVPLVLIQEGVITPGASPAPANLVDIAPTILELIGLTPLEGIDGVSLVDHLHDQKTQLPPSYLETRLPWIFFGWSPLRAIREREWKLIEAPRPELYDLASDPGELRNLIDHRPEEANRLRALLHGVEQRPPAGSSTVADDEVLARLRTLGYVGAGGGDDEIPTGLPDPKDRLELRDRLQEGEQLLEAGRNADAVQRFEEVLAIEPDNRFAVLRSGIALLKDGRIEKAIDRLERSTVLDPNRAEAHYALADAFMRNGSSQRAAVHWQEVVRLQPRRGEAWFNLGVAASRSDAAAEALSAFRTAVELEPDEAPMLAALAQAEAGAGNHAAAIELLDRLRAIEGDSFTQRALLGLLLAGQNRPDAASEWLRAAEPDEPRFAEARLELARIEAAAGRSGFARAALDEALTADPGLRTVAAADPDLAPLLVAPR